MTTEGDDLLKGNPWVCLYVSYPTTLDYVPESIYPAHYKSLAHSENPLEAHPLVIAHLSFYLPGLCASVLWHQVQQTWAKYGYTTSGFLAHVNFSLIPESLLLLISSDFLSHFTLICSQRRIHWGKG